jgi:hypothetical protein
MAKLRKQGTTWKPYEGRCKLQWLIFCGKTMFFPWVPFIQMHVMINVSFDILIGTWIQINNFIIERTSWLFINKNSFVSSNGLLKLKNMDWSSQ